MQTTEPKNKAELLARHEEEMDVLSRRSRQQKKVIEALPPDVSVDKAFTAPEQLKHGSRSAAHGIYEISVEDYSDIRPWLETFPPLAVEKVEMARDSGREPSVSFYPLARVPEKWRSRHKVKRVAPLIWQASPFGSGAACRVSVEWYTLRHSPTGPLYILVRAKIKTHDSRYERFSDGPWTLRNYPAGRYRFSKLSGDQAPPYATVWWLNQDGDMQANLGHLLAHLEGGPKQ